MQAFYRIDPYFFISDLVVFEESCLIRISMWEDDFPARLHKVSVRVSRSDDIAQIRRQQADDIYRMYQQKSALRKQVEKLLALDDLRRDIQYGFTLPHACVDMTKFDDHIIKLEQIAILTAFIFAGLARDIDAVRREIVGLDDPDQGYIVDKLSFIDNLLAMYQEHV